MGEALGFSICNMPLTNRDDFSFFFLIWMSFISFSCLVALAIASGNVLTKSVKSGHPCLVPDHKGSLTVFITE